MIKFGALLLALGLWLAPGPALAADAAALLTQTQKLLKEGNNLKALYASQGAVQAIWNKTPFHLARAVLTQGKSFGYGAFNPRANNHYLAPNPTLHVYLEPRAYKHVRNEAGIISYGFVIDLYLVDAQGRVRFAKENYSKMERKSRLPNREFSIGINLNLKGFTPGDYHLKLVCHDMVSKETAQVNIPLKVKAAEKAEAPSKAEPAEDPAE